MSDCPMRLGQARSGHTYSLEGGTVCCWCGARGEPFDNVEEFECELCGNGPGKCKCFGIDTPDALTAARARIAELEATLAGLLACLEAGQSRSAELEATTARCASLAEQWRPSGRAVNWTKHEWHLDNCADELEAALAGAQP